MNQDELIVRFPRCPICGDRDMRLEERSTGTLHAFCTHFEPQDPGSNQNGQCRGELQIGTCDLCGDRTWIVPNVADMENGPSPADLDDVYCVRCSDDHADGIVEIVCTNPKCRNILDGRKELVIFCERIDMLTAVGEATGYFCPTCGMDESGLDITRIGDVLVKYEVSICFPDGSLVPITREPFSTTRLMKTWESFHREGVEWEGHALILKPVEFQLRWIPSAFEQFGPDSGRCKHGTHVGGIGIDWMCGECEMASGTRWDDAYWARKA